MKKLWLPVLLFICGLIAVGRGVSDRLTGTVHRYHGFDDGVSWVQMVVAGSVLVVLSIWIGAKRRTE